MVTVCQDVPELRPNPHRKDDNVSHSYETHVTLHAVLCTTKRQQRREQIQRASPMKLTSAQRACLNIPRGTFAPISVPNVRPAFRHKRGSKFNRVQAASATSGSAEEFHQLLRNTQSRIVQV